MKPGNLHILLATACLLGTLGCSKSSSTQSGSTEPKPGAEATAEATKVEPEANTEAKPQAAVPAAAATVYERSENGATTTLRVLENKGGMVRFQLAAKTPQGACDMTFDGTAKEKEGDAESREDDSGQSHFVAEYVLDNNGCGVSISLDMEAQKLAWVSAWDCPQIKANCELTPGALARK